MNKRNGINMKTMESKVNRDDILWRFGDEPEQLFAMRKSAWEAYNDTPLPDRTVHLWRYTNPENFLMRQSEDTAGNGDDDRGTEEIGFGRSESEYAGLGSDIGYGLARTALAPRLHESGIIFKDLKAAILENDELAGAHLGRLIGLDFGKFEALNLSLWDRGLILYIPDNITIEKPILLHRQPRGAFTAMRLLVVIGENSEISIIDDYSNGQHSFDGSMNGIVEIYVGDSSRLRYANLQRLPEKATSFLTHRAHLSAGAQCYTVFGALGGGLSKINTGIILNGRGADSRMFGIVFGSSGQHLDCHTVHHHTASESYSNIDFKVILKDRATSAYTGLIKINQDALNCEAFQENRNLILNRGPRAESIPELEILCDQVRCTHGATMGPVDPELLFYLQNRGIDRHEAVRTVVSGFVEPTLNRIPGSLGDRLRDMVHLKLQGEKS
jgi:Fe-S cluster assembly protein SufD